MEKETEKDYKTDYIHIEIILIKRLHELDITNYGEMLLLAKIITLSKNENKACTAGNEYLAKILCTTERNIQKYLKDLKEKELVKTFEKKEGVQTLIRYIYPQYKKLGHEQMDTSSEGDEHLGKEGCPNGSKDMNKRVKSDEQMDTHIIEYNRNIIEENRDDVASLQSSYEDKFTDEYFKAKGGLKDMYKIIKAAYNQYVLEKCDNIREMIIEEFTNEKGWYKCTDKEAVIDCIDYIIKTK